MKNLKIIIIGKNQTAKYDPHIISHEYLENSQMLKIFATTKIVVIPSKFDSNPNILTEAVAYGCNVVTSKNVGNYENLDGRCLVQDYQNADAWAGTIHQCLDHAYPYTGPSKEKIVTEIKNLFIFQTKKSVGIYKIPPEINNQMNDSTLAPLHLFNYKEATNKSFAHKILNYDIYFQLFVEISLKEKCGQINYILYDADIEENVYVNVSKICPYYPSNVTIWKLNSIRSYSFFTNADVYFIRGTYYNFFKHLVPSTAKTIFYPATSLDYGKETKKSKIRLLTTQKFDILLKHGDSLYDSKYSAKKTIIFNKFTSDLFVCYSAEREYDICFVATEKQTTKNHDLFLHFLCYLENKKRPTKIIYIADLNKILETNGMENQAKNFQHVILDSRTNCGAQELIQIYNKSRINILFSGRDACPRVISESSACGCFNIALDTLTDGKDFYDGYLGVLVGDNAVPKIVKVSASLSYSPDDRLWEKIVAYMDKKYDHADISVQFKRKYNLQNVINQIYQ